MLAGHQSPLRVLIGRAHAADGLHHHADVIVLLDLPEVIRHQLAIRAVLEVPDQNGFDLKRLSPLVFDLPGVFRPYFGHAGAHRAQAHNCDLYHLCFLFSLSARQNLKLDDVLQAGNI